MSDPVSEWLQSRRGGVPDSLADQMGKVLANCAPDQSVADAIRGAADTLMRRAVDHSAAGNATELLAADALITYMCEAVSEIEPGSLMDLS